jgi:prepilin-type N-terminal cleavage/methylation domain-containing protein
MQRSNGGFTLFEITVVLVILAITGLLVYPSFKTTVEKARMDAAVRDVASLLKYAREKAMGEQEVVSVVLRRQEADLTIFNRSGKSLKHYKLWEKVAFQRLILDGLEVREDRAVVWFYPDGRSTGIAMILRSEAGRQLRLKTDILTGNTWIYGPGEKGFEDEIFQR